MGKGGKGGKGSKSDYEVGYKKPPKDTQFQPGQSGCPSGGKKRAPKTIGELALETGDEPQRLLKDGKVISLRKRETSAKQLYLRALNGETAAFVDIIKLETAALIKLARPKLGATAPAQESFDVTLVKMGKSLATHCDECGEPGYEEIRKAMREYAEQGYEMPPLRHNGRHDERIAQLELEMEKQRALADAEVAGHERIEPPRRLRRKKNLSLGEWLLIEGSTRIKVKGVWKSKRKHILDVQYLKANKGDRKAILAIDKVEVEAAKQRALAAEGAKLQPPASPMCVTLEFDDEAVPFFCDACGKALQERIARARQRAGL